MAKILVIEDEQNLRLAINRTLTKSGHEVSEAGCLRDARAHLARAEFDLVLTDVMLGSETGLDLVRELRASQASGGFDGVIVVMTAYGTIESAVAAMQDGADDYLQKPLSLEELALQTDRWLERRTASRRLRLYERMEQARDQSNEILGSSPPWRHTLSMAAKLASMPLLPAGAHESTLPCILLLGETGVGKGVLARYVHARACEHEAARPGSAGTSGVPPFVHVNCSALPPSLVESELFGHEKGAFTDARDARAGLFEMADGGTIFLDEVSETPIEFQSKLLLVVERGTFRRVGGSRERSVQVRIIAASNQDLEQRAAAGTFRRDLLYRLNALTIRIPPLRERPGDAVELAEAFVARLARRYGRKPMSLSAAAREALANHSWPGNVRELVNAIQRAVMLCDDHVIEPHDLALPTSSTHSSTESLPSLNGHTVAGPSAAAAPASGAATTQSITFDFDAGTHTADGVERELIIQALARTGGNVSRAARLIGMQRSSLRYRIDRYRLESHTKEASRT
ncbi:MAG: sigma-54-dependent Fis family transcriptional regulator [Phycisphaeraceae bacterium]|nr:sigma-54-dependent Fis family transcriptional regulator [Phycisphaeraceae bacterium]